MATNIGPLKTKTDKGDQNFGTSHNPKHDPIPAHQINNHREKHPLFLYSVSCVLFRQEESHIFSSVFIFKSIRHTISYSLLHSDIILSYFFYRILSSTLFSYLRMLTCLLFSGICCRARAIVVDVYLRYELYACFDSLAEVIYLNL